MATGFYNLSKKLKSSYKKCGPLLNPCKNVINIFPKKEKFFKIWQIPPPENREYVIDYSISVKFCRKEYG
jgi:hypothetical protein